MKHLFQLKFGDPVAYMRNGSELRWFKGRSTEYIYGTKHRDTDEITIADYQGAFCDPVQWIELMGRMLYRETRSIEFCDYVVKKLAKDYGVSDQLREEPLHPMGGSRSER